MNDTASEAGRVLAARRRRSTYACEACGKEFEAWARKTQIPRTCSPNCRQRLRRQQQKQAECAVLAAAAEGQGDPSESP